MSPVLKGRATAPLLFIALLSGVGKAGALEPFVVLDVFAHSEPVPVHAYIDDWDARLRSGTDAVTHNRLETGVRSGRWTYSYVQRYDYEVKASPDAALLYHQIQNKIEFTPGKIYDLDLRAFHNRSQGLRLAYRFDAGPLEIEPGVSLLSGQALIDGRIRGIAEAIAPKEYRYEADVRYHYSEDVLFDRPVSAPDGEGVSLDLRLQYRPGDAWLLQAQGYDLLGMLRWHDAPVTDAVATSDTQEIDEDGFTRYHPTLSGRESNENYSQRLHPRGRLAVEWSGLPRTRVGVSLRLNEVGSYLSLSARQAIGQCWGTTMELLPQLRAAGLGVDCGRFRFSLLADSLRFEKAQVLQLGLSVAYPLGASSRSVETAGVH